MEFVSDFAPLVAAYWPHMLCLALLCVGLFVISRMQTGSAPADKAVGRSGPKNPNKITIPDETEHPLAEFAEENTDPSFSPPLNPEDTPRIPYRPQRFTADEMIKKSREYYETLNKRRSVRFFSKDPVPLEVIENIVKAAGTSPSGAHSEPWTFVVVKDPQIKLQIREIIEQEEYLNYDRRMGEKWVNDLKFMGTSHEKPYLEEAPYLIIVMKQQYHAGKNSTKYTHYYYEVSTAIAAGFLLTAIQMAGLVSVTTTILNAGVALRELLGRPDNEKVMLLLPVGYPSADATVPGVGRKPLEEIMVLK